MLNGVYAKEFPMFSPGFLSVFFRWRDRRKDADIEANWAKQRRGRRDCRDGWQDASRGQILECGTNSRPPEFPAAIDL